MQQLKQQALSNWKRLEQDILAEAESLRQPCIECLRDGERPPNYTLLAPLNHRASVSMEVARDYIDRLKTLALNKWRPEKAPRPALGYVGFEEVAVAQASPSFDRFIREELNTGRFQEIDQTDWLFSHSGMKIPSNELFEEVYQRQIMQNRLLANSKFGRY